MVLKTVKDIPGITYNELGRLTNLSNGVITHYILQLIENGDLEKFGDGRPKYFHAKIPKNDQKIISILRNQTNKKIVELLLKSKSELTSEDISKNIKKSRSTVSVSMKILQKMGIIEKIILNKKTKVTSDIGFQIHKRKNLENFCDKYNILKI